MSRFALCLVLAAFAGNASATCSVAGTAYDASGRPMHDAVVRLVDLQTGHAMFSAADAHAGFAFDAADGGRYRLDILSPPTVVTGTKIPTRSILGMSDAFACSSATRQDVRAQVY